MDTLDGRRLDPDDRFCFQCHSKLPCFNRCCRNLKLILYPYDVLRLKNHLEISSERFIDDYVDVVLRKGEYFPEVLLRMAGDEEQSCPFLSSEGCTVYSDRPDTCRTFPVEQGAFFDGNAGQATPVFYLRPPHFCLGPNEPTSWTAAAWAKDQETEPYQRMTRRWSEIRRRLASDPWGQKGPQSTPAKMTFMAVYNTERFREFIFKSSFLKRYKVKSVLLKKLRHNDDALLSFGFDWVNLNLWRIPTKKIRLKK